MDGPRGKKALGKRGAAASSEISKKDKERCSQQTLVLLDTQKLFLAPISKQTWSFFNRKLEIPSHQ